METDAPDVMVALDAAMCAGWEPSMGATGGIRGVVYDASREEADAGIGRWRAWPRYDDLGRCWRLEFYGHQYGVTLETTGAQTMSTPDAWVEVLGRLAARDAERRQ